MSPAVLQPTRVPDRGHLLGHPPDEGRTAEPELELELALEQFLAKRNRLFGLAYRMIGEAASAEDVVQEAWLRWWRADHREIRNPAAFLITTTSRLALNVRSSAQHRRETPAGTGRRTEVSHPRHGGPPPQENADSRPAAAIDEGR